jgi:hypothetical protein
MLWVCDVEVELAIHARHLGRAIWGVSERVAWDNPMRPPQKGRGWVSRFQGPVRNGTQGHAGPGLPAQVIPDHLQSVQHLY